MARNKCFYIPWRVIIIEKENKKWMNETKYYCSDHRNNEWPSMDDVKYKTEWNLETLWLSNIGVIGAGC